MLKGSCSWPARNRKGGPPVPATASAGFLPARRWGRPLLEEDGGRRGRAVHVWLPRGVLELTSDGGAATRLLVVLGAPSSSSGCSIRNISGVQFLRANRINFNLDHRIHIQGGARGSGRSWLISGGSPKAMRSSDFQPQ